MTNTNIIMLLTPKKQVTVLEDTMTIGEAIQIMNVARYTSVPLLDKDGLYVGTLTEGDLLMSLLASGPRSSWGNMKLKNVSRLRDNDAVRIDAPINSVFETLVNQNFIPIVDDRGMFIGIVTRKDLINYYLSVYNENREDKATTVMNNIKARRSIRKWKTTPVDRSIINQIIMAGLVAPTAKNRKPVNVVLVTRTTIRETLAATNPRFKLLDDAPYALFVYGDTIAESNEFLLNNDCSAAIENMLLAIEGFGLGGVWIGMSDEEIAKEADKLLGVPQVMRLHGIIAFGHKDEEKTSNETFDLGKIHNEGW